MSSPFAPGGGHPQHAGAPQAAGQPQASGPAHPPRHAQPVHQAQPPRGVAEVTIARIRQHANRIVIPSLVTIVCAAFIGYAFRELRESGPWLWWGIIAAVALLLLGLVPIILWLRTRYTITTYRTSTRKGQPHNTTNELPHHLVSSVEMHRNGWQAIFGSGTITLLSVSGLRMQLRDVPNAVTVTQALRELTGNPER
ncbi:PH domain-containing protein [Gulosibacter sp. ACHW.36C]|uniref:PH domain-containing protein n=1 Tax=Gulosibacter sediminis TaxID=1729695 RepID=A0ABY4MXB8_9MICO|nr:PH domain-containing protein [Gulosibacter sediminis]UQN14429.1 PH domain-containing protein [Gulosibacter sediminis]